MTFHHKKHIFFDLDHTLWDFDKNSALTFEKIFKLNNLDIDLDSFLKVYVPINLQYWKLYREEKIDKKSLKFARLNDAFKALDLEVSARIVHKLSDDYITYLSTFNHLFPDTIALLEYLQPKYTLHIITNGFKEVQHGKLNQSHIDHYFQTVTNSEMVGVKKPNPKIFKHALHMAKATAEESLMIGDNLEADIMGALNFGMDAICFNYHKETLASDIIGVDHLSELKMYL
ncbi:MAG: YjjG family noncanonical pyrimidine nucleotidase [Flavobacteriaceae bacterium]|jgi:putative hydrolase of the HAD superfamily|nr:YjjG family noncanonical pyrimidine nucleotidase [Flavobacteriaceae bacterium]MDG1384442.1 YjjG family noncanonical pyrimidine nucleotidase [Flavobacteriaceae bacterium]